MRKLLVLLVFFLSLFAFSHNYEQVDTIVKKYPNSFRSIKHFANRIAKDFTTNTDKTRAAYYWISNNIVYDYKSLKNKSNGYKTITTGSNNNYEKQLLDVQRKYAERSLRRKLAVCEGYSQLLRFTLLELEIETQVVKGFARISPSEIGRIRNTTNHAWNAVKINNEWKLIDTTWSTGSNESAPNEFTFTDSYFFISPEDLIVSHFPKKEKWQLLESPISKAAFFYQPLFYETYYNSGLKINKKQSGLIKVKNKDFIEITFDSIDLANNYYYTLLMNDNSKTLLFQKKNGVYITKIPINLTRKTVLTIYNGYSAAVGFKIIIDKLKF